MLSTTVSRHPLHQTCSNVGSHFCLFPYRLYHITLWTFLLALGHFLSELFVFGTAAPTVGVLAPLMVASKPRATLDSCSGGTGAEDSVLGQ